MANFPCNPMLYIPPGLHLEQAWVRPARSRVALGGEPPRRHEQYAVITLEPPPIQEQVHEILEDVTEVLQQDFPVRVVSSFPSPLGLGLFQFENPVQRQTLLDASPIQFGHGWLRVQKHDEARNFRACPYIRQCWIMFLAFPLDYQTLDFIRAAVAPFGRLIHWFEGPNKSRVLTQCLVLSPDRVPRSVVVSQGTMLGGNGRSWSVPVYILGGHFPDAFPPNKDPVPVDGNPHPMYGAVNHGNPNIIHNWQHDQAGADQAVHMDAGINVQQMQDVQHELAVNGNDNDEDDWPDWMAQDDNLNNPVEDEVQQESISFDQSGSTAEYLRAHGPDIELNIDDVLKGKVAASSGSSSSSGSAAHSYVVTSPSFSFLRIECIAFANLTKLPIPRSLQMPIHMESNSTNQPAEPEDVSLAIVPFRPSLHAVLIKIWADSQEQKQNGETHVDPRVTDDLADDHCFASASITTATLEPSEIQANLIPSSNQQCRQPIRLPTAISAQDDDTPLEVSAVRRSSRISAIKDGYKQVQHVQLEDNPRKKRRVWKEVPLTPKEAAKLLENPPQPTDEEIPGEIPAETLKDWGIECNVAPEELTIEALNKEVANDHTTA
ncbi:unnamed protein product [Urochloa humidicola]